MASRSRIHRKYRQKRKVENHPDLSQITQNARKSFQNRPKMGPSGPPDPPTHNMPPRSPQKLQGRLPSSQDALRRSQDALRSLQEASKKPSEGSEKPPQDAPEALKEVKERQQPSKKREKAFKKLPRSSTNTASHLPRSPLLLLLLLLLLLSQILHPKAQRSKPKRNTPILSLAPKI